MGRTRQALDEDRAVIINRRVVQYPSYRFRKSSTMGLCVACPSSRRAGRGNEIDRPSSTLKNQTKGLEALTCKLFILYILYIETISKRTFVLSYRYEGQTTKTEHSADHLDGE